MKGLGGDPHSPAENRYHLIDSNQSGEAMVYSPACASVDLTQPPAAVGATPCRAIGSSNSNLPSRFQSPATSEIVGGQHTTPAVFMGTSQRRVSGAFSASPMRNASSHMPEVHPRGSRSVGSVISDLSGRRANQKGAGTASSGASIDRRSAAEPRLLWSDLDVSGASSTPSQEGRGGFMDTATPRGKGSGHLHREVSVQGGYGGGGEGNSCSPEKEVDAQEDDEEEEARDILAVCRHGDTLGIAAVSNNNAFEDALIRPPALSLLHKGAFPEFDRHFLTHIFLSMD